MQPFDSILTVTLNPAFDRVMRIDGFRIGGHQKGETMVRVPAGKGVNVSRVLSRLDVPSIATGLIGKGQTEEYEASFLGSQVRAEFLAVEGRTRENVTVVDPSAHSETHLRDVGLSVTRADLGRLRNKINLLAKPGRLVIFSGSLPPGIEVGDAVELIDIVQSSGARAAIDGPADLLRALADRSLWLVKPNVAELLEMAGPELSEGDESHADRGTEPDTGVIQRVIKAHLPKTEIALVSRGASGGNLFTRDIAIDGHVAFDARRVQSTVGCGDCLLAAFIAQWQRGDGIEACFRYALAAATAASTEIDPGSLDPEVIDALFSGVLIVRL